MRRVLRLAAGAALLVSLAGCGSRSGAEAAHEGPEAAALNITVTPVAMRPVERTVSVVGTLAANEEAELASETEGQVIAVEADLGDRVTRDRQLLRVRCDVVEARLREAEASMEKAAADLKRAEPLHASAIISAQEYEQLRTAHTMARARRDALRIELERAAIRAPFDGSVSARLVSLGDYVRPGTIVYRVVQDDPLKFRGEVAERDVPAIQPGQEVRISVDPYPGETFVGRVSRIGAAADPTARALAFEVLVPNGDHRIRPGFFGHGDVIVRHDPGAPAVPRSAVTTFAGVTKLFVVENGVAHEKEVTLGVDLGDGWIEIAKGVAPGMVVATTGVSRLTDGVAVVVRQDAPPGA